VDESRPVDREECGAPPARATVAFVAWQLSGGGAERQLYYLLQGLRQYPLRVVVATLNPGSPGEGAVEELGIPVERIPPCRWKVDRWKLERVRHLAAWLRRERPLLVHSWAFGAKVYTAWAGALAGVPVRLGSLRGDAFYENTVEWKAPPFFLQLGLQTPHLVVANSATAANAIAARGPRGARLRVVRNGMDLVALRAIAASQRDGATGRADVLSPRRPLAPSPRLALVGRLIPRKNAPMFLRVIAGLAALHPGVEGWLIGDGPERAALESLAQELGIVERVQFWGERSDVIRLLGEVDILCHCSHSEGLCNAIMEASALGLPVVATRAGGTDEIVEDCATGFVVNPDDAAGMTRSLDRLLRDPNLCARMGEAGHRKMEREFSLQRMVEDMIAVYQELLEQKALGGVFR
jgi:glycosyltransferase involved in cell wall biosynthesis